VECCASSCAARQQLLSCPCRAAARSLRAACCGHCCRVCVSAIVHACSPCCSLVLSHAHPITGITSRRNDPLLCGAPSCISCCCASAQFASLSHLRLARNNTRSQPHERSAVETGAVAAPEIAVWLAAASPSAALGVRSPTHPCCSLPAQQPIARWNGKRAAARRQFNRETNGMCYRCCRCCPHFFPLCAAVALPVLSCAEAFQLPLLQRLSFLQQRIPHHVPPISAMLVAAGLAWRGGC